MIFPENLQEFIKYALFLGSIIKVVVEKEPTSKKVENILTKIR